MANVLLSSQIDLGHLLEVAKEVQFYPSALACQLIVRFKASRVEASRSSGRPTAAAMDSWPSEVPNL